MRFLRSEFFENTLFYSVRFALFDDGIVQYFTVDTAYRHLQSRRSYFNGGKWEPFAALTGAVVGHYREIYVGKVVRIDFEFASFGRGNKYL